MKKPSFDQFLSYSCKVAYYWPGDCFKMGSIFVLAVGFYEEKVTNMKIAKILFIFLSMNFANLWAQRIIALAPSLTEAVCTLELCDQLVGVTSYCSYPPEVSEKTKIGGYLAPNLETILSLKPSLILALPEHRDVANRFSELGLRVATLKNYSVEDIHNSLLEIGRLANKQPVATNLVNNLKNRQSELVRNPKQRLKCLLVLGHDQTVKPITEVYAVGGQGFLNDLIHLAGLENVVTKKQPFFPKFTREGLMALNPDIIVELLPVDKLGEALEKAKRTEWQGLGHLKAVRNKQVFFFAKAHVLQAGPRYVETLEFLSQLSENP